jgi:3-hydroxyacyl-[acyl-carrier-protein] dehydratase
MPLNDLFTYSLKEFGSDIIIVSINLNVDHKLYKGHFPDKPVTPGVALIEIIRQILSATLKKNLMLTEAKDIKFIASVVPPNTNNLELEIKFQDIDPGYSVNCILSGNNQVYTKLRGIFSERK